MDQGTHTTEETFHPFDVMLQALAAMEIPFQEGGRDLIPCRRTSHRSDGKISFLSLEPAGKVWSYELYSKGRFCCLQLPPPQLGRRWSLQRLL